MIGTVTEIALELYAVASTERSVCLAPTLRNRERSSWAKATTDTNSTLNPATSQPTRT
jgi:hypothetical protein